MCKKINAKKQIKKRKKIKYLHDFEFPYTGKTNPKKTVRVCIKQSGFNIVYVP